MSATLRSMLPILLSVSAITSMASRVEGDDWPQWFGPQRDAVWRETGVAERFPEDGPRVRWRTALKKGYSGPAVAGGHVYVMDRVSAGDPAGSTAEGLPIIPGQERVLCLDALTGETKWQHTYDCEYQISYPDGPRTTPLVDGDRVYTLGAMGDLLCLSSATGQVLWSKQLLQEYELGRPLVWGWSASPMLDGDRLICLVGGKDAGVVAFDKQTGKEIWRAIDAEEIGYAPPVIHESEQGRRQLLVWHDVAIQSLDPATGQRNWRIDFPEDGEVTRPAVTIAHPRLFGDRLLISDFYNGTIVLQLDDDRPDAEVVWVSEKDVGHHTDSLNTLMAAAAIDDGHIYGMAGNGELRCLDANTGEVIWRDLAPTGDRAAMFATTFIIRNGDRWFLATDQGELIIARLSPDGYEEVDRAKLLEPTSFARGRNVVWSHPAFANRCIYWRNDDEIICADLSHT